MSRPTKSGVVIAKILGNEGFTPRTASAVRKWTKRRDKTREHRRRHMAKVTKSFSEMVKRLELSQGDRMVMGRFISMRESDCFEAGVLLGLQCVITGGLEK